MSTCAFTSTSVYIYIYIYTQYYLRYTAPNLSSHLECAAMFLFTDFFQLKFCCTWPRQPFSCYFPALKIQFEQPSTPKNLLFCLVSSFYQKCLFQKLTSQETTAMANRSKVLILDDCISVIKLLDSRKSACQIALQYHWCLLSCLAIKTNWNSLKISGADYWLQVADGWPSHAAEYRAFGFVLMCW